VGGAGVITLRGMTRHDIDAVVALEQEIYPAPWSANVFFAELQQPGRTYVVAEDGDEIVGYGGMMIVIDEAHITTIAVTESRRGHRLGTRLMHCLAEVAVKAGAKHLTLEVRASNRNAQALYRRFGMGPVGVRKDYYIDEDALIMWVNDIDGPEYASRLTLIGAGLHD